MHLVLWCALTALVLVQTPTDRSVMPPLDASRTARPVEWAIMQTTSGARLFVNRRTRVPLISLRITFPRSVSDFEPVGRRGLGAVTAAMLREGTHSRSVAEWTAQMRRNGEITSAASAIAGDDHARLSVVALTHRFPEALELLADMLANPALSAEALDRVRRAHVAALGASRSSRAVARQLLLQRVGGTVAFLAPTEESLGAIQLEEVRDFHRRYYQLANAIIVVEGDIEPSRARRMVEQLLTPRLNSEASAWSPQDASSGTMSNGVYLVDRPAEVQSVIFVGGQGPSPSDGDFAAMEVLHAIVGGQSAGSRINLALRDETGYSYGVESSLVLGRDSSAFFVGASVRSPNAVAAVALMVARLRALGSQNPVAPHELQTAKKIITEGILLRQDESAASVLERALLADQNPDHQRHLVTAVSDVTVDALTRVAARYLDPHRLTVVVTGDRRTLDAPLRALNIGPVTLVER